MTMLLIPIIILFVIIVVISRYSGQKVSVHAFKWVAGLYGFILITGLSTLYLLPADQLLQSDATNQQIVSELDFYQLGIQGKLDQTEGVHRVKLQTFNYLGEKLVVDDYGGIMVFVKRKNVDDGIIAAEFYISDFLTNRLDFSDKVKSPLLTFHNGILDIRLQSPIQIKCYGFGYELPIKQFLTDDERGYPIYRGMNAALYLEAPQNMQIEGRGTDIQFVNEEGK